MKVARVAEAGAQGTKGKVVSPAIRAVAARTRFDERTLRAVVGAVFLFTALRTVVRGIRAAARETRS